MHGDVVGFVALDLILRLVLSCMVGVAFVIHVSSMHFYDMACDHAGFGIPGHVVADFELIFHREGLH